MNVFNYVRSIIGASNSKDKKLLELANKIKNKDKIIASIAREQARMTNADIQAWRNAWQIALNPDNPNRAPLYDIYRDTAIDSHLTGIVSQRQKAVTCKAFKIVNSKGEKDDKATNIFKKTWFGNFKTFTLDSILYGHSLIELGEIEKDNDDVMFFKDVVLIPRRHVVPQFHIVKKDIYDDINQGIDYHDPLFEPYLIEVGNSDDLGLYLNVAKDAIPKRNALAFWDSFAEIFGMPLRIARTSSRDSKDHSMISEMMAEMGAKAWALLPEETSIDIIESTKGDAFNVYDRRVARANSEMSKAIVGQTMTTDDGSSLSQSKTHFDVRKDIVDSDAELLADIINTQLIPKMIVLGFPLKGCKFEFDEKVEYTPEQQLAYEKMLADRYEIPAEYFEKKYDIPVGKRLATGISLNRGEQEPFFD